jgi:C4-dicarboxylate transporter DctM subunit
MTFSVSIMLVVMLVILFGGILLGFPIVWALFLSAITAVAMDPTLTMNVIAQRTFSASYNYPFIAIPCFFLAGDIMSEGGLSGKLVDFANSLLGWVHGGLSIVTIVACAFFAAISGSSVATTAAIGSILYPELHKKGYPKEYAASLPAIGGTLGIIIPPSIVFVIYGNITNVSISKLLMAGVIPGILCCIMLCVFAYYTAKKRNFPLGNKFSFENFLLNFKKAGYALLMPVIMLGGIYLGIFTPTESATIAVIYGFLVCFFIYRKVKFQDFRRLLKKTALSVSGLLMLCVSAQVVGYILAYYNVPEIIINFFLSFVSSKYGFIVIVVIVLLISGMFLDVAAINLILAPMLAPVALQYGMDPVHFGLIFVFLLSLGQATPPYGVCIFVSAAISKTPVERIAQYAFPFILVELTCILVFAFVPIISTFLPSFIR